MRRADVARNCRCIVGQREYGARVWLIKRADPLIKQARIWACTSQVRAAVWSELVATAGQWLIDAARSTGGTNFCQACSQNFSQFPSPVWTRHGGRWRRTRATSTSRAASCCTYGRGHTTTEAHKASQKARGVHALTSTLTNGLVCRSAQKEKLRQTSELSVRDLRLAASSQPASASGEGGEGRSTRRLPSDRFTAPLAPGLDDPRPSARSCVQETHYLRPQSSGTGSGAALAYLSAHLSTFSLNVQLARNFTLDSSAPAAARGQCVSKRARFHSLSYFSRTLPPYLALFFERYVPYVTSAARFAHAKPNRRRVRCANPTGRRGARWEPGRASGPRGQRGQRTPLGVLCIKRQCVCRVKRAL